MIKRYKNYLIDLFNNGILTEVSDAWFNKQGYKVIRSNNQVVDIIEIN